jgi:hypothetical protein
VAFVDVHKRVIFAASAVISSSGAMKPSIENTPSVVTRIVFAPSARACFSCVSRSDMLRLA